MKHIQKLPEDKLKNIDRYLYTQFILDASPIKLNSKGRASRQHTSRA